MNCFFCHEKITGYGNSSEPVSDKPCCNFCNMRIVVPIRLASMQNRSAKVALAVMQGEPQMEKGLKGTVNSIDDAGQIHVDWDNHSTLALIPGKDIFTIF